MPQYPSAMAGGPQRAGLRLAMSVVGLFMAAAVASGQNAENEADPLPGEFRPFAEIASANEQVAERAAATLLENWHDRNAVMLLEVQRLARHPTVQKRIVRVLERGTGERFGDDREKWFQWIWKTNPGTHPRYATFKAKLYATVDPRFAEYFADDQPTSIRLDEIRWGNVLRDGIPPLKNPKMISAGEAAYLKDQHVVFGVEINGDARAYPKRILAWHEMVKDTIGGESLNGVYCTLCGSMILYRTEVEGQHYELGTSGFLYRSNKLMYDHDTKSLWCTLTGEPVVGPLVGKGIELEPLFVVTTTWGEWRKRHPETTVLSLDTGHQRDYGEGVAYRKYFSTDRLMFGVPELDTRLKNKDEVLALRTETDDDEMLAISAKFLQKHPVYHDSIGATEFVVLTDASGANRVYETEGTRFACWDGESTAVDTDGRAWTVTEAALDAKSPDARRVRLPAHRAFWFGWYSFYPRTRLVK